MLLYLSELSVARISQVVGWSLRVARVGWQGQGQEVLVGREVVESSARRFVEEAEKELMNQCTRTMQAAWNYQTDLTTHHRTLLVNEQDTFKRMQEESRQEAGRWRSVDYLFTDSDLKDRLDKMSVIGLPELPSPSMTSVSVGLV
ncbi:hypothetical protein E2C01_022257 [Portunus trituberculatus]|uniref:Uncharacterized protein n=1 Tax=Portunus trituberculatus TaxID=210409 RepID=A0A5B7E4W6_PORTR|nr:hypothetical protein [Portunus trituberculatus]